VRDEELMVEIARVFDENLFVYGAVVPTRARRSHREVSSTFLGLTMPPTKPSRVRT
jgi:hypothetical protein